MGKWKNDIVIEESDRFVKIGERIIEITSFDSDYVYEHIPKFTRTNMRLRQLEQLQLEGKYK